MLRLGHEEGGEPQAVTEVVSLHGQPIIPPDGGNPHVVALLEVWLDRARAGQLTEIALAGVYLNDDAGSAWAGDISITLLGSVTLLLHKLNAEISETSQEN